jgi:hypothetical protein
MTGLALAMTRAAYTPVIAMTIPFTTRKIGVFGAADYAIWQDTYCLFS